MNRDPLREVLVALVFFGGLALLGWQRGVFAQLGDELLVLAAFAAAFAALTWTLDDALRAAARRAWRQLTARGEATKAPAKSPGAKRAAT